MRVIVLLVVGVILATALGAEVARGSAGPSSWSIEPVVSPPGATYSLLSGVSCPQPHQCVAVGAYATNGQPGGTVPAPGQEPFGALALAEDRDAGGWHIQAAANPVDSLATQLWAVSCVNLHDCMAVGSYDTDTGELALVEHWDGTSWEIEPAPSPPGASTVFLGGVSCPAARDCTAVGYYTATAETFAEFPLAEHWDGSSWTLEPTPDVPGASAGVQGSPTFTGVSCPSRDACTAVGSYPAAGSSTVDGLRPGVTLAERWDGSTWSIQSTPTPTGATFNSLQGVSCASRTDCMAVGSASSLAGAQPLPLAERWNGSTWQIQKTVNPPGNGLRPLEAVSCATVIDCTAVGYFSGSPGVLVSNLAERWDGMSWTIDSTPQASSAMVSGFLSVSCPKPQACIAVGGAGSLDALQTSVLGEQVDAAPVTGAVLYAVPSAKRAHFVALRRERRLPVGSLLDTTRGTVRLTSAMDRLGDTQSGEFSGGIFKVLQKRAVRAATELLLTGGSFVSCNGATSTRATRVPRKQIIRRLRSSGRGRFRTRGRYSTVTAQAATWDTIDRCDGTLTIVYRGSVVVSDLIRHKNITVTAGHRYLARAP